MINVQISQRLPVDPGRQLQISGSTHVPPFVQAGLQTAVIIRVYVKSKYCEVLFDTQNIEDKTHECKCKFYVDSVRRL